VTGLVSREAEVPCISVVTGVSWEVTGVSWEEEVLCTSGGVTWGESGGGSHCVVLVEGPGRVGRRTQSPCI